MKFNFFFKSLLVLVLCEFMSACQVHPKPFQAKALYANAQHGIQKVFANQPPVCGTLDFPQAMARALQFNLDNRLKQADIAVKAGQLQLAEYSMLPVLGTSASVSKRNNDNSTFGSTLSGRPNQNIAFGTDRTLRSARLALTWNVFDLGMGFIKTLEEEERLLIAEEESRQQLQKLIQDLRVAYWSAYSAQQFSGEIQRFNKLLQQAKGKIDTALSDPFIPKEPLLNYQASLLQGSRKIIQLEDKLNKAEIAFKYLINIPTNEPIILKKPSSFVTKIQNLTNLNFAKLDAITLVKRPEVRGQGYQKRIAELGPKKAILKALPVISLNRGLNYNSNSFLVNNFWNERQIEASWNIFNLTALPVSLRFVKTQINYESLKWMAVTLGVLNETRIAYAHYQNLLKEYDVAHRQTLNAKRSYQLLCNQKLASLASQQDIILSELQLLFSKMDETLLLSELHTALGQLYIASGFDVLPPEAVYAGPNEILSLIEKNLSIQDKLGFKGYIDATYKELFNEEKTKLNQ